MLLWTLGWVYLFKLEFSFSLITYSGVELLDHIIVLSFVFQGISTVSSSAVTAPMCIPTQNIPFFPHTQQNLLFVVFLIIVILIGVRWHVIVILICNYLIVSNIENYFMCLLAICMSSLQNVYPIFYIF